MADPLLAWLEHWGTWLDDLLASGLTSPGRVARQRVLDWCETADLLGYSEQAQAARDLLAADTPRERRATLYYWLLVQQDLLQRLFYAEQLERSLENSYRARD